MGCPVQAQANVSKNVRVFPSPFSGTQKDHCVVLFLRGGIEVSLRQGFVESSTMFRSRSSIPDQKYVSRPSNNTTLNSSSSGNAANKLYNNSLSDSIAKRWKKRRYCAFLFAITFISAYSCWVAIEIFIEVPKSTELRLTTWQDRPQKNTKIDSEVSQTSSSRHVTLPSARGPLITHSIPLPLPKDKVSVILMNFSRPRMIMKSSMMQTLLSHPSIDEVHLLHANEKTAFDYVHNKVKNIDAIEHNNEMGLSLRFYFCQIARNEWVLHLDDDMEFTTEALNELIVEFGRNPKRIVGKFGRNFNPGNSFNGYNSKNSHKNSEVVLTKFMLMERSTCKSFFDFAHLVWNDIVLHNGEGPLWNGEDIFMSLVANHVYERDRDNPADFNNYAMDWLDVWQANESLKDYGNGKLDISGGMRGIRFWSWRWWQTLLRRNRHYSYRGRLWKVARDRLKDLNPAAI